MAQRPVSSTSYHHGELREALLQAALALVEEGGVQNLSLRKAAQRAGVSSGAPYHHFRSRGELMAALGAQGFRLLGRAMSADLAEDPGEDLCLAGQAYVRFAEEHVAYFRIMFRPELMDAEEYPELQAASAPVFESLVRRVLAAQGAGQIPEGDHERYVLLAWSVTHGLSSLLVDGPLGNGFDKLQLPRDQMGELVVETLMHVLRGAAHDGQDAKQQRKATRKPRARR
ncbi:MAG: TetR/AcrR family transcriptional regulator [Polyangiaceae bacterium]